MQRFIRTAEHLPGGFDDIWLLGDVFGHSDESTGAADLTRDILEELAELLNYSGPAVRGNWEYWLTHPERDSIGDQGKYTEDLAQRRQILADGPGRALLDRLAGEDTVCTPEGDTARFTLFHGCAYACHGNSDYQPVPCECYLFPRDLNTVTRGLFGNSEHLVTPHFLFGHTHIPGYFTYAEKSMVNMWQFFTYEQRNRPIPYGEGGRRFGINPGSAGIAGRNLPRTAVLLDTAQKTFTYLTDEER